MQPSLRRKICHTLVPEGRRGKFFRFTRSSLLFALATAAVIAGVSPLDTPFAAPPTKASKSKRFFESLLSRPEKPPQFIEAPTPPTAEQVGQTPRCRSRSHSCTSSNRSSTRLGRNHGLCIIAGEIGTAGSDQCRRSGISASSQAKATATLGDSRGRGCSTPCLWAPGSAGNDSQSPFKK